MRKFILIAAAVTSVLISVVPFVALSRAEADQIPAGVVTISEINDAAAI